MNKATFSGRLFRDFITNKYLYLMMLPVVAYYAVFQYAPMYGVLIAFKDYSPLKGIMGSPWAGLEHFKAFFDSYYFLRVLKNTVIISVYSLLFEFPAPILLALMINEVRSRRYRNLVQTVTYMPYFISMIVIAGLIRDFTDSGGVVNTLYSYFGGDGTSMLQQSGLFRPLYILSEIWQKIGWESIIYLAALMAIDQEQYEAARIDGAGRLKQMWYVTLPGILPTIVILFILRMGNLLNVGFEKIILLYNPVIYDKADVISSFVYRKGLLEFSWSYSTAVGVFNSLINLTLLVLANWISKRVSNNSLW
ncbi:ABC transporter permease [Cohnella lupini]|uniref:Carbohydrate ABC transporter membrane protein 1 (CUT1 family) n=1 Tax=Cohnella lupini TaxID=1294267 RepID=A0A3D9HP02_9BACL|nr:ABC transporter permease subunit [Cohnella lupini]RED51199.1 carbohydrate ABC transporter membrane protein 1 (CUT1 family) [Cohnella lupini]